MTPAAHWDAAAFENSRYTGEFEGLIPGAGIAYKTFKVSAQQPLYRIVRNGLVQQGAGDLSWVVQQDAFTLRTGALGWRLAGTVPVGDPRKDLGMGHSMLMPSVFSRLRWRQFGVDLTLEYGKAVTASHTHHQNHRAAYFPLVHPMNASELTFGALGELRWWSGFGLRARLQRATPIADARGTARAIVGVGVVAFVSGFSSYAEWQTPIEGEPFTTRVTGGLAFNF